VRLDRYLHDAGLGTRREIVGLIRAGRVTVEGALARRAAAHVGPQERVTLDGEPVVRRGPRVVAFHKPAGLVTSTRDRLPTIYEALPFGPELLPVGRLDRETEGLLLLTDDGLLLHRLTSPRRHVEKEYLAQVAGALTDDVLSRLREPLAIGRGESSRAALAAERAGPDLLRLVIDEGRYHQVRRMCAAVGLEVRRLIRLRVGPVTLGDLPPSAHRELAPAEQQVLRLQVGL
jgi:16S rRNA pseudouridine516 synthase